MFETAPLLKKNRGRPDAAEAQARRARLLLVAADLFSARGFEGVSIDAIAAESGISKTTIYAHFGGKEGLYRAITSWFCRVPGLALNQVETRDRAPEAVLLEFIHVIAKNLRDAPAMALLRLTMFEQPRFPEIAQAVFAASLETVAPLTRYLAELVAAGHLSPEDPERLACQLVALIHGGYQAFLLPEAAPDPRRVLGFFLRGAGFRREV
jgi:TetR/AcrR family transcriptional repressor of mexJK operon